MRAVPLLACVLLILAGCGKSSDPPKVTQNITGGEGEPSGGGNPQNSGGKQPGSGGNKNPKGGTKGQPTPVADGLAFDTGDPQKTLHWLATRFEKVRSATDKAAREAARTEYDREVKTAEKQKIHWTLKVDTLTDNAGGVVLATVTSPADTAYGGLRLAPSKQPEDGTVTFVLELPEGADGTKFRPGERVTVDGVVEKVVTSPQTVTDAARHPFQVRLSSYTLAPAK